MSLTGNAMGHTTQINPLQTAHSAYPSHAGGLIHNALYGAMGQQNAYNNQAMAAQQQAVMAQTALARQYAQQQVAKERRWMCDGQLMTLQEFMDFIWPEDCPEKTWFALKYTKENSNES